MGNIYFEYLKDPDEKGIQVYDTGGRKFTVYLPLDETGAVFTLYALRKKLQEINWQPLIPAYFRKTHLIPVGVKNIRPQEIFLFGFELYPHELLWLVQILDEIKAIDKRKECGLLILDHTPTEANTALIKQFSDYILNFTGRNISINDIIGTKQLHQKMLSALAEKGFDGLSDEEQGYWMSVY